MALHSGSVSHRGWGFNALSRKDEVTERFKLQLYRWWIWENYPNLGTNYNATAKHSDKRLQIATMTVAPVCRTKVNGDSSFSSNRIRACPLQPKCQPSAQVPHFMSSQIKALSHSRTEIFNSSQNFKVLWQSSSRTDSLISQHITFYSSDGRMAHTTGLLGTVMTVFVNYWSTQGFQTLSSLRALAARSVQTACQVLAVAAEACLLLSFTHFPSLGHYSVTSNLLLRHSFHTKRNYCISSTGRITNDL